MSIKVTVLLVFLALVASHIGFLAIGFRMGLQGRRIKFFEGIPLNPSKEDVPQADQGPIVEWVTEDPWDKAMEEEETDKPKRIATVPGDE